MLLHQRAEFLRKEVQSFSFQLNVFFFQNPLKIVLNLLSQG